MFNRKLSNEYQKENIKKKHNWLTLGNAFLKILLIKKLSETFTSLNIKPTQFYFLPKIRKINNSGRSISSSICHKIQILGSQYTTCS